ncbi:hypothetical protein [Amycolatopsis sp. cg9]
MQLLGRLAIALATLSAVVLLVRGSDLAAVVHDLVAFLVLLRIAG